MTEKTLPSSTLGRSRGLILTFASGAALTGCGDPVVGEWDVRVASNTVLPEVYQYDGCTYSLGGVLVIDEDLDARMELRTTTQGNCDYAGYVYATFGEVDVDEKGDQYTIELRDQESFLRLECDMSRSGTHLDCRELDFSVWRFEKR